MSKEQLTLAEKVRKITLEMCKDLGFSPDEAGDYARLSHLVEEDLTKDAMMKAKEKLWQGKI